MIGKYTIEITEDTREVAASEVITADELRDTLKGLNYGSYETIVKQVMRRVGEKRVTDDRVTEKELIRAAKDLEASDYSGKISNWVHQIRKNRAYNLLTEE